MRILVVTNYVPFIHGGGEVHAVGLRDALRDAGHETEIAWLPFQWSPPERILDQMLACRLLNLTESSGRPIDLLIALKFPAYLVKHPRKVIWLMHEHRSAYSFWENPSTDLKVAPAGALLRDAIRKADRRTLPSCHALLSNSKTVSQRLSDYLGIKAPHLYHPPAHMNQFHCAEPQDYLYFPSRLNSHKRQALVLEALARTRQPVQIRFSGAADEHGFDVQLKESAASLGVAGRVAWLGHVSNDEKIALFAQARGVVFPPLDEDYGYVTLEAMLASKPVITCVDSGGPLEFITDHENGFVTESTPEGLASAMDALWTDQNKARALGEAGRRKCDGLGLSWSKVVETLCGAK